MICVCPLSINSSNFSSWRPKKNWEMKNKLWLQFCQLNANWSNVLGTDINSTPSSQFGMIATYNTQCPPIVVCHHHDAQSFLYFVFIRGTFMQMLCEKSCVWPKRFSNAASIYKAKPKPKNTGHVSVSLDLLADITQLCCVRFVDSELCVPIVSWAIVAATIQQQ